MTTKSYDASSPGTSRSLCRREGATIARLLNEQPDAFIHFDDLYSSTPAAETVSSETRSLGRKSPKGTIESMTRAISALSARTSAMFQRKKIPDFTGQETPVQIPRSKVPRIIITPADNVLYSSEGSVDSFPTIGPTPPPSCSDVSQLILEEPLEGMDSSLGSIDMVAMQLSSSDDGQVSINSSSPSSGPSTPRQIPLRMHDTVACHSSEEVYVQDESFESMTSTEIAAMFHQQRRQWKQPNLPKDEAIKSVDAGQDDLTSSVQFNPTYTTVLNMMRG